MRSYSCFATRDGGNIKPLKFSGINQKLCGICMGDENHRYYKHSLEDHFCLTNLGSIMAAKNRQGEPF